VDSQADGSTETPSNLAEAVRQLESLRLRGELTEETVASLISQYMPSVPQTQQPQQPPKSNGTERRRGVPARQVKYGPTREAVFSYRCSDASGVAD
jgi:hypothetical protein